MRKLFRCRLRILPISLALISLLSPSRQASSQQVTPLTLENIFLGRGARQAAISPDGEWVAVTANGTQGSGIYLLSTRQGELSEPKFWVPGGSPAWSPDSRRIVFSRAGDLWTVSLGSNEAGQITRDALDERAAVFAPDARTIVKYYDRVAVSGGSFTYNIPVFGNEVWSFEAHKPALLFDSAEHGNNQGWSTDWTTSTLQYASPSRSWYCSGTTNDLVSWNLNTSGNTKIIISFSYRKNFATGLGVWFQVWNGSSYDNVRDLGTGSNNAWLSYTTTLTAGQYFRSDFKIKFEGTNLTTQALFVDDIRVEVQ